MLQHCLILRWTLQLRLVHWGFALAFLALLGSGLALGNPDLRGIPFLGSKLVREVHLTWAILLVVLPAVAAAWDGFHQVRQVWDEVVRFDPADWHWLGAMASRVLGRNTAVPPAGRLNAGQKLNALLVVALATSLAITGAIIAPLGASPIPASVRELIYPLHVALAYATLPVVAGHVLLATVVPGTRDALRGIVLGSVRHDWARANHAGWLDSLTHPACDSRTDGE